MGFIEKFGGLTEEYKFYNGSITLRFDKEDHKYYRMDGDNFILVNGCTTVCHIINKSEALVPWAAKVTVEKLLRNTPTVINQDTKEVHIEPIRFDDFKDIAMAAKSAHKEHLDDAANVGHMAHEWIESYINSKLDPSLDILPLPEDDRAKSCITAALSWMDKHNVRWISTERKIYSKTYEYAGTADGLCIADSCDDGICCPIKFKDRLSLADWKSSNYLYIEYLLQTAAYEQAIEEEDGITIQDRWVIRLGKEDGAFQPWHCEDHEFRADFSAFVSALNLYKSVNELEDRMKYQLEVQRQAKKLKKEAEKAESSKIACKYSSKYKGVRYPTCNQGNPCETCLRIYNDRHSDKKQLTN